MQCDLSFKRCEHFKLECNKFAFYPISQMDPSSDEYKQLEAGIELMAAEIDLLAAEVKRKAELNDLKDALKLREDAWAKRNGQ